MAIMVLPVFLRGDGEEQVYFEQMLLTVRVIPLLFAVFYEKAGDLAPSFAPDGSGRWGAILG